MASAYMFSLRTDMCAPSDSPRIAVITCGWVIATVLAFSIGALHEWRPVSIAGLVVGVLGTSIFLWQRRAVRRGHRGAQRGLI